MTDSGKDQGLFPKSVGEQLAEARVAQKLELADIAERTRIPERHLRAIEQGNHEGLPAIPYSAGFVKSYANMLGLDGQAMSTAFRSEVGEQRREAFQPEAYEPADPSRVPSKLLAMVALGVALLLGMGYLLLRFEGDSTDLAKLAADTPEEIHRAPAPARPNAVAPTALAQPAVPAGVIAVNAAEDVWVKISERDGPNLLMGVMKAGERFEIPETAVDPILRTGRPQVIKVTLGETALPPIGEPDRLVRAYSLKRDALVAIATGKPVEPAAAVGAATGAVATPAPAVPARPLGRRRPAVDAAPVPVDPNGAGPAGGQS
jgi:cytoskeleton protein RodZ